MRKITKIGSKINSKIGKAINDYNLIEEGDKILLAVSGGKDSLTMLTMLKKIQSWAPVKFSLVAAHIISDFNRLNGNNNIDLEKIFNENDIEVIYKDIKVLDAEEKTNCFWCSWNRRKALFEIADESGCNKVALGHHKDDIAETMLMNLLYNGEISAINPRQELFKGKVVIIRPLCYVEEAQIIQYADEMGFSSVTCNCAFGDTSKRKYVKDFLNETERLTPRVNIKSNIVRSLGRIKKDYIEMKED